MTDQAFTTCSYCTYWWRFLWAMRWAPVDPPDHDCANSAGAA